MGWSSRQTRDTHNIRNGRVRRVAGDDADFASIPDLARSLEERDDISRLGLADEVLYVLAVLVFELALVTVSL
jgi:hypothetical protein